MRGAPAEQLGQQARPDPLPSDDAVHVVQIEAAGQHNHNHHRHQPQPQPQRRQSHEFEWSFAEIAEALADWQAEWRQRGQHRYHAPRAAATDAGPGGPHCCPAPVTCSVLLREAVKVHAGFLGRVVALLPLLLLLPLVQPLRAPPGLALVAWLLGSVWQAAKLLGAAQAAAATAPQLLRALAVSVLAGGNVVLVLLSKQPRAELHAVLSDPATNLTVGRLLFLQVVADSLVQLASLATQQLLLLLPAAQLGSAACGSTGTSSAASTRGRAAADAAFGLCRALLPVWLWCLFFVRSSSTTSTTSVLRGCLLLAYVAGKGLHLQSWLLQLRASLAAAPSCRFVWQDSSACCPICYEEHIAKPLVLSQCCHVFCRACAVEWVVGRQQATCPMCRCPVANQQLQELLQETAAERAALESSGGCGSGAAASEAAARSAGPSSPAHVPVALVLPQLW